MRGIIERIRFDWNELNNVSELEIIKKYSAIGRFITLATTCKQHLEFLCFQDFVTNLKLV